MKWRHDSGLSRVPTCRTQLWCGSTLRSLAKGTGPAGPFEAPGADRLIVIDGFVAENLILSDHPVFAAFAKHVGDLRPE
jgi:hypothetical protein